MDDKPEMQSTPAQLGSLGGYQLIKLIGEGAAGQVFLAEQQQPHRQVAVKVLRSAAAAGRARFEREVELLANLEHNNIARLYDSGTADGPAGEVPYLVMEFVDGLDLLSYANQQQLDMEQRLKLLAQVARAAHFAHTRGVIHRDLKPGNILVNARGEPKILDFGVAHVVADDATQMTGAGEILGTLAYMSWEQLCGEGHRIDARADVYALGVIGYQLVSGAQPYPGLAGDTLVGALGRLQRETPPRLSSHQPGVAGDVETLISTAMARESGQRYGSAAEFAADIERFLRRQPIEARPPTLGYVISLFVRRHKAISAAAIAVAICLIASSVVSMRFAWAESQARQIAETRLDERKAVTEFLTGMFASADPERALGDRVTVLSVLDVARAELAARKDLAASTLLQMQRALGNTYIGIGRYKAGLTLLQEAESTSKGHAHTDPAEATQLGIDLANALLAAGQEEAALKQLESIPANTLDAESSLSLELARAHVLMNQGHFSEAEALLVPALERAHQTLGATHETSLDLAGMLAHSLQTQAELDRALEVAGNVLKATEERLGQRHPRYATTLEILANIHRDLGHLDEAIQMSQRVVEIRTTIFGAEHAQTLQASAGLAATLAMAGRAHEGLPHAAAAHEGMTRLLGPDAEMARAVASLYAYVASEADELETAARINRGLIQQAEAKPEGPSVNDLVEYNNLGNNYRMLGQIRESATIFRRLVELASSMLPEDHLHLALFRGNLGEALRRNNELEQAATQLSLALPVVIANLGEEHTRVAQFRERLERAQAGDAAP